MKKIISFFKIIIIVFVPTFLVVILFWLGRLKKVKTDNDPAYMIVGFCVSFLFLIVWGINYFYSSRKIKRVQDTKKLYEEIKENKNELVEKAQELKQQIIKEEKAAILMAILEYIICLFFVFLAGSVTASYSFEEDTQMLAVFIATPALMPYIIFMFILGRLLFTSKEKTDTEKLYPETTKMIKSIFKEEGIDKKIKVYLEIGTNVSIFEQKGQIDIIIGLAILKFLSKEEIKSIIYHEIGHYFNSDTKISAIENKYHEVVELLMPGIIYYYVAPSVIELEKNKAFSQLVSNIKFEQNADDYVLTKNVGDAYASAVFKIFGLTFAEKRGFFKFFYLYCKNKEYNAEVAKAYFDEYKSYYDERIDFFLKCSKVHLERQFDTHPNVRQRIEKFATKELNTNLSFNEEFDNDIINFFVNRNLGINENLLDDYQKFLKEKDECINKDYQLDDLKLQELMDAAAVYDDFEFEKELARKLLEKNPNLAVANYYLGFVLAFIDCSDECLPYLYKVKNKTNSFISQRAIEALGEYLVITGKKEERDKLREEAVDMIDDVKIIEEVSHFTLQDKLKPYNNNEVVEHLINMINDKKEILSISIGTKEKKNHHCHFVLCILKSKTEQYVLDNYYNEIISYLNLLDDQYNLLMLYDFFVPKTHRIRRKPILIYKRKEK